MGFGSMIGGVIQGVAGPISQSIQNRKNRRFAAQQTDKAFHRNVEMWKWQNQYNSPQEQMQRLRAAGINKLLPFVGGGQASGGTAATPPAAPKAEHKGIAPQVGTSIQNIYDLQLKKAGTDKLIEETSGLKTANERALITWLQDKGFIKETQAAQAAQKIAEAGLKDIELGRLTGKDAYFESVNEKQGNEYSQQAGHSTGYGETKVNQETIKKANALIDANAENIRHNNLAKKALKEWLDNPKGGWEALKATLLIILGK